MERQDSDVLTLGRTLPWVFLMVKWYLLRQEESNGMFREGMVGVQWVCKQLGTEILERRGMKGKSPLNPVHLLECIIPGRGRVLSLTVLVAGNPY